MIATSNNGHAKTVEPDIVSILQQTVSASRLNCWLQCRLKFYFRYVLKLTKPKTAALHYGSVLHLVLQQWNMARWRKQPFDLERLRQVFDNGWADQQQIEWDGEEDGQKASAWSVLERYFAETPIGGNELPEAVEVSVEADLSHHGLPVLIGVLDLVRSGGRIVDFKSTGKTPDNESALHQNGLQLDCYSILYREAAGKREGGRELHHLVKTKVPKVIVTETGPMQEHQRTRLFRLMENYVEGLERKDFVPAIGMQCAGCEFRNECAKWSGYENPTH
jgi:putative RecB family exonuclease